MDADTEYETAIVVRGVSWRSKFQAQLDAWALLWEYFPGIDVSESSSHYFRRFGLRHEFFIVVPVEEGEDG